jgi:hypothetical protein
MTRPALRLTKKRLLFSVVILLFLGCFVLPSTIDLARIRWRLASALKNARAVRLEEFEGRQYRRVLSSVDLRGRNIGEAFAALPYAPDLSCPVLQKMCIFAPHHRIVAVAENGATMDPELCFTCGDIALTNGFGRGGHVVAMPFAWRPLLHRLFTRHGIPVRDGYNDFN